MKITNHKKWIWVIILESILFLYILGIFLSMQSKPYPFKTNLQPFPFAMITLCVMFMFLILIYNIVQEK